MPSGPVTVTACGPCGDPSGQRSAVSRWPPTACPLDPLELYGLWVPTCGLLPPPQCPLPPPSSSVHAGVTAVCLHPRHPQLWAALQGAGGLGTGGRPRQRLRAGTCGPDASPSPCSRCSWNVLDHAWPRLPGAPSRTCPSRPPTPPPRRGRPFKATSQGCGRPGGLELRGLGRFWSAHGHWVCSSMGPRART